MIEEVNLAAAKSHEREDMVYGLASLMYAVDDVSEEELDPHLVISARKEKTDCTERWDCMSRCR